VIDLYKLLGNDIICKACSLAQMAWYCAPDSEKDNVAESILYGKKLLYLKDGPFVTLASDAIEIFRSYNNKHYILSPFNGYTDLHMINVINLDIYAKHIERIPALFEEMRTSDLRSKINKCSCI
jgi:hypothetical protein